MSKRMKGALLTGAVLAAAAGGGAAIAGATGGGDDGSGTPITGSQLDKASAVALQQTGGGRVTASEIRDEQGYYEIEVTKPDGSQVDVHLDRGFHVLNAEADGNGSKDDGSGGG
jgi:uncharacterized membrane protein YkoI